MLSSRILFCCLVLIFVSCNKSSDNNDPVVNTQEVVKELNLQGKTFRGDCHDQPINEILTGLLTLGEASVQSQRIQYRFTGANVARVTHLYGARDCSGPEAFTFEEAGEMRILENSKTADGATLIDFDFKKVDLTVSSQEGVVIANRIGVCNQSDWAINTKRDVTPTSAEFSCYNVTTPRLEFNIYRLDGNVLYFGTQAKANTVETRPTVIRTELKYTAE